MSSIEFEKNKDGSLKPKNLGVDGVKGAQIGIWPDKDDGTNDISINYGVNDKYVRSKNGWTNIRIFPEQLEKMYNSLERAIEKYDIKVSSKANNGGIEYI